jgi:hypothetical protein
MSRAIVHSVLSSNRLAEDKVRKEAVNSFQWIRRIIRGKETRLRSCKSTHIERVRVRARVRARVRVSECGRRGAGGWRRRDVGLRAVFSFSPSLASAWAADAAAAAAAAAATATSYYYSSSCYSFAPSSFSSIPSSAFLAREAKIYALIKIRLERATESSGTAHSAAGYGSSSSININSNINSNISSGDIGTRLECGYYVRGDLTCSYLRCCEVAVGDVVGRLGDEVQRLGDLRVSRT